MKILVSFHLILVNSIHTILRYIILEEFLDLATPQLTLNEERSLNGIPNIAINFPNGHMDNLILDRYFDNDQDRIQDREGCRFLGHLENESEACVAVTG